MTKRRALWAVFLLSAFLLALGSAGPARAGDDWLPISQEELAMKDFPGSPGAHAVVLYREEQSDSVESFRRFYYRIKILTEEGKKRADIEIPYIKEFVNVRDIRARVIRPDGTVVNFEGKPFDKTVVKARGVKFLAKTLTLPDVQVGSIIEYKYKLEWDKDRLFNLRWVIQEDLFTRRARFTLRPYRQIALRWINVRMPNGKGAKEEKGGLINLELENIPAFQKEEFMPPENELKPRVDFFYTTTTELNPDKFWKDFGKRQNEAVDKFVGHRKGIERAVAEIVSPNDSPEAKLRKLYARVQQIRNLTFEREKTEKEEKREKLKDADNVEDLLKRGYGSGRQISWLFLAFARAAGFEAWPVLVSRRNEYFFALDLLDVNQLNDNVVLVRLGSQDLYFDPGTAYCPFGLLPWGETGVKGLRLDKDGGTFVTTILPSSSESRIERRASLELTNAGELEGGLSVTFTGLEALGRRLEHIYADDAERRKSLEDEVKRWLPVGSAVELKNAPTWNSSEASLQAEFDVRLPHWANSTGRRILMPVAILAPSRQYRFEHAERAYPVYFDFPFETTDEITLKFSAILQVSSVPEVRDQTTPYGRYQSSCRPKENTLRIERRLTTEGLLIPTQYYAGLRNFHEGVRAGDEQQVVLQAAAARPPK